ncbi:succinate dehydrogenase, hydrophobic membrane anchor protein [Nitrosomonas supralitoralis]|uniref:Succinate dehydrogenase hydrophobic membrane anchor subunit n=1 Tax=Nitrosomonas supralitoralis TaxID=2116706 RepID=A0A2P7NZR3_9PROT|nr:succinate dehydrogenase, hydrophobic membrane anchor protein [Nitrosomonas supralitoralis]PSJ18951.1 succinate dehydrogenase, hydrophobic membrane anchor protein [Nitrosomonas supralitoralis]
MVRQSKLAVTGAHYGSKDWLAQRVTAILMTIYLIVLMGVLFVVAPQDYAGWKGLFQSQWLRIATFVFFICVFLHAWVGVRNVLMDYVHPVSVRLMMQITVVTALLFYLVWTAEILWS